MKRKKEREIIKIGSTAEYFNNANIAKCKLKNHQNNKAIYRLKNYLFY